MRDHYPVNRALHPHRVGYQPGLAVPRSSPATSGAHRDPGHSLGTGAGTAPAAAPPAAPTRAEEPEMATAADGG